MDGESPAIETFPVADDAALSFSVRLDYETHRDVMEFVLLHMRARRAVLARRAFGVIALAAFIAGPVWLFRTGDLPWWLWGLAMYALSLWSVLRADFSEEDFAANDRDGAEQHYRLDAEGVEWSLAVAGESCHGRYAYGRVRAAVDVTSRGWVLLVMARSGPVFVFLKDQMDDTADAAVALLKARLGDRFVTYAGGRLKLPPEPGPA